MSPPRPWGRLVRVVAMFFLSHTASPCIFHDFPSAHCTGLYMSAPRKGRRATTKTERRPYGGLANVWNEREDLEKPTSAPTSSYRNFQVLPQPPGQSPGQPAQPLIPNIPPQTPVNTAALQPPPNIPPQTPVHTAALQPPPPNISPQLPLQVVTVQPAPPTIPRQTSPHNVTLPQHHNALASSQQQDRPISSFSYHSTPPSSTFGDAVDPGNSFFPVLNSTSGYISESPTASIPYQGPSNNGVTSIASGSSPLGDPTHPHSGGQVTRTSRTRRHSSHPYSRLRPSTPTGAEMGARPNIRAGRNRSSNLPTPHTSSSYLIPGSSSSMSIPTYQQTLPPSVQTDPQMMFSTMGSFPPTSPSPSNVAIIPTIISNHLNNPTDPHSEGQPTRTSRSRRQSGHPYVRPQAGAGMGIHGSHNGIPSVGSSSNIVVPGPSNQFTSIFPTPGSSNLTLQQQQMPFSQYTSQSDPQFMATSQSSHLSIGSPNVMPSSHEPWDEFRPDFNYYLDSSTLPVPPPSTVTTTSFHMTHPHDTMTPSPPTHLPSHRQLSSSPHGSVKDKQIF
ncbi:hypothetical protein Hypma_012950 [Hypsizygus marmoreus]|uniref:Uncharacterized protein n=1 Tax=Hypsizygus marmoreus TaxID=39966 RepID=A0A369JIC2_HYPMA|nr:hypothetical protein Hypma_012950 [Hypsizygus marmoreus]